MNLPNLLSTWIFPTLGGLIVGFALGVGTAVRATARPRKDPPVPVYATDPDTGRPARRPLWGGDHLSLLGIVVVALAMLGVIVGGVGLSRTQAIVECQASYNAAYTRALADRTEAAASDRKAIRDLLRDLNSIDPGLPPEQRREISRAATERYLRQSQDADAVRDASPLPERPAC